MRSRLAGFVLVLACSIGTPVAVAHAPDARPSFAPTVDELVPAASASSGPAWCGAQRATDNVADEVANGAYRYHAIYLRASDAEDRFAAEAGGIQASAFGASALLERLYSRAIRFDMGTNCGPANLDISLVRSSRTTADFAEAATRADGTLKLVTAEVRRAGFKTFRPEAGLTQARRLRKNFVVWLDAPAPAGACGAAEVLDDSTRKPTNWNNLGGKVAVIFRDRGEFCGPAAVRHEVGHTLGALTSAAPNAFDGAHCDDAYEDTMCYPSAPQRGSGEYANEYFDFGNDDYWDPPKGKPLKWWTANLNRFLCPTASCNAGVATAAERPKGSGRRSSKN